MRKAVVGVLGAAGAVLVVTLCAASAAVFQYSVEVPGRRGPQRSFLWIPPRAEQVRGVVAAATVLAEQHLVLDPRIREACAEQSLALLYGWGTAEGGGVQGVLDKLAGVSGYRELSVAPLLFIGHSAAGPAAKAQAVEMAERCFGLVQYRGGGPGGAKPVPPGVPALMMVGQFDEFGGLMRNEDGREGWEGACEGLAAHRAGDEANLVSIVVEPGAGHFAWSGRNGRYLALYLRGAAAARIPAAWPVDAGAPVALKRIDPRSGWLTDLKLATEERAAAAAWGAYEGDRERAAWHFDRELAEATEAYHVGLKGRRDQFIRWRDPCWVDAGTRFFFTRLKWVGDGRTLEVHPVYADKYPRRRGNQGPKWLKAGEPVGHSEGPILVKPVGGPLQTAGANLLRVVYHALSPAGSSGRWTFMAYSEGDDSYRHTEHVGMMPRGFRGLGKGKAQTITFPPLADLSADGEPVELKATSDSGLPVDYYVGYGPARVVDGSLAVTELPRRAVFPLEVQVVACQFGSGIEPLVRTAEPVIRILHVKGPGAGTP